MCVSNSATALDKLKQVVSLSSLHRDQVLLGPSIMLRVGATRIYCRQHAIQ